MCTCFTWFAHRKPSMCTICYVCRPSPYDSAVSQQDAQTAGPGSQPATRRHDDDEAFALAAIQPFQLGCRGTASVRGAFQVLNKARPRRWWNRGEGAPLLSCSQVSALQRPLTGGSSRLPQAARAGWHLRSPGPGLATGGLSILPERRAQRPQAGCV